MKYRAISACTIVVGVSLLLSGCGRDQGGDLRSNLGGQPPYVDDAAPIATPMETVATGTPCTVQTATPSSQPLLPAATETPADPDPSMDQPQATLPLVAANDEVIVFGTYEADAISASTIAGQDGVTQTARVVIEPGESPLYIILTSYEALIWRFEGEVSRVRQVVLLGWTPHGVTGISAPRVADLTGTGKLFGYFDSVDSPEAAALRDAVEELLGRPIDVMAGEYSVGTVSLPSATVAESIPPASVPPGLDPSVYWLGTWYNPGGIVDIEPSLVVSTSSAEAYEVLPEGFGLAQLVATGAVEAREDYFYIVHAIPRFPAGLYGAHSVAFVLASGIPVPAGDPGHSCVLLEETGLPLDEWLCEGPLVPATSCEMPEAPAVDEVILFGSYEGDTISTAAIAGQDATTNTARVVVAPGDTQLYLVLTALKPIIWRFEGATSRIDRTVLIGHGTQGVTGLPAAVVTDRSGTEDCPGYFYDAQSPDGVAIRGSVERALGRPVDVIGSSYSVGTLSLPSMTVEASIPPSDVPPGLDPEVYGLLGLWFNPGGVVEIDPALVVSAARADTYEVLPSGFGLAQLVATGALDPRGSSVFFGGDFYIARAIPRFPADLTGAQAVAFLLGRGVPLPAGTPGHSCVISEETGLPLQNEYTCAFVPSASE